MFACPPHRRIVSSDALLQDTISSAMRYSPSAAVSDTLKVSVRSVPFSVTSVALSKRNKPADGLRVALPNSSPATALSSVIAPFG